MSVLSDLRNNNLYGKTSSSSKKTSSSSSDSAKQAKRIKSDEPYKSNVSSTKANVSDAMESLKGKTKVKVEASPSDEGLLTNRPDAKEVVDPVTAMQNSKSGNSKLSDYYKKRDEMTGTGSASEEKPEEKKNAPVRSSETSAPAAASNQAANGGIDINAVNQKNMDTTALNTILAANAKSYSGNSKSTSSYDNVVNNADFAANSGYTSEPVGWGPFNGSAKKRAYINKDQQVYKEEVNGRTAEENGDTEYSAVRGYEYLLRMTDEEIKIYNYLYNTKGKKDAEKYLDEITPYLNQRTNEDVASDAKKLASEHPVYASAASVLAGAAKPIDYASQTARYVKGKLTGEDDAIKTDEDKNSAYSIFSSNVSEQVNNDIKKHYQAKGKTGETASFLYNTGMSMANFLFNSAISGGSEAVCLAIMGSQAAADEVIRRKEEGLSDDRAFILGTAAGIIEGITEKIGYDALFGNVFKGSTLKYMIANTLAETFEEGTSDVFNLAADSLYDLVTGENASDFKKSVDEYIKSGKTEEEATALAVSDWWKQLGLDMLGGALSGGVMAAGGLTYSNIKGTQNAKANLKKSGNEYKESVISSGLKMPENSEAYKTAKKASEAQQNGKDVSASKLGKIESLTAAELVNHFDDLTDAAQDNVYKATNTNKLVPGAKERAIKRANTVFDNARTILAKDNVSNADKFNLRVAKTMMENAVKNGWFNDNQTNSSLAESINAINDKLGIKEKFSFNSENNTETETASQQNETESEQTSQEEAERNYRNTEQTERETAEQETTSEQTETAQKEMKVNAAEEQTEQPKATATRSAKAIGKKKGDVTVFHRSYTENGNYVNEFRNDADGVDYDVVEYDNKSKTYKLKKYDDFDGSAFPVLEHEYEMRDGKWVETGKPGEILTDKHRYVSDDYTGFSHKDAEDLDRAWRDDAKKYKVSYTNSEIETAEGFYGVLDRINQAKEKAKAEAEAKKQKAEESKKTKTKAERSEEQTKAETKSESKAEAETEKKSENKSEDKATDKAKEKSEEKPADKAEVKDEEKTNKNTEEKPTEKSETKKKETHEERSKSEEAKSDASSEAQSKTETPKEERTRKAKNMLRNSEAALREYAWTQNIPEDLAKRIENANKTAQGGIIDLLNTELYDELHGVVARADKMTDAQAALWSEIRKAARETKYDADEATTQKVIEGRIGNAVILDLGNGYQIYAGFTNAPERILPKSQYKLAVVKNGSDKALNWNHGSYAYLSNAPIKEIFANKVSESDILNAPWAQDALNTFDDELDKAEEFYRQAEAWFKDPTFRDAKEYYEEAKRVNEDAKKELAELESEASSAIDTKEEKADNKQEAGKADVKEETGERSEAEKEERENERGQDNDQRAVRETDDGPGRQDSDRGRDKTEGTEDTRSSEQESKTDTEGRDDEKDAARKNAPSRSAKEIGLNTGTDEKTAREIPYDLLSDSEKKVVDEVKNSGFRVVTYEGDLWSNRVDKDGKVTGKVKANGAIQFSDKTIFLKLDDATPLEQLAKHEMFHFVLKKNKGLQYRLAYEISNKYSDNELFQLECEYISMFGWDASDPGILNYALEEILCDAYAGTNVESFINGKEGAAKFTDVVRNESAEEVESINDGAEAGLTKSEATKFSEDNKRYKARMASFFSGAGTVDYALRDVAESRIAVEADKRVADTFRLNNGEVINDFVQNVDTKKYKGEVDYFHASPVCKNYSSLNSQKTSKMDNSVDMVTATATANAIENMMPKVFTLEQVPGYDDSDALKVITDKLDKLGYKWDKAVYKASDYGAATSRERLFVRASLDGELPAKPQKTEAVSWYAATKDMIGKLPDWHITPNMQKKIDVTGIDFTKGPVLVLYGVNGGKVNFAYANEPCPSIKTDMSESVVILGDGTVKRATPDFYKRIMGLPDDFKLGKGITNAYKVVGNGVPVQLTQAVCGGLIEDKFPTNVDEYEDVRFSEVVTDKKTLDDLNEQISRGEYDPILNPNGGYLATYKSMSFWGYDEDGNAILRSPMAEYVDGKLSDAYKISEDGKVIWYKSTEDIDETTGIPRLLLAEVEKDVMKSYPKEDQKTIEGRYFVFASRHPDLIKDDWSNLYFELVKKVEDGVKKNGEVKYKNSPVPARYNPYEHSSNLMLNDQFDSAWRRGNLVTVKMYVPMSEANGTHHTKYAKDATGWTEWHSGIIASHVRKQNPKFDRKVFLSNYAAPVEIVSDKEVAQAYKQYLEGTDVKVPDNVVSPNLLKELKAAGVPIKETGKIKFAAKDSFYSKNTDATDADLYDVRFSEIPDNREKYTYESLVSKPDMEVIEIVIPNILDKNGRLDRANIRRMAFENADKIKNGTSEQHYVYVPDVKKNVLLNRDGLDHGMTGRVLQPGTKATAIITPYISDILGNSIAINELYPRSVSDGITSYILIGFARDQDQNLYLVKSTVNEFDFDKSILKDVEIFNVLYSSKARKIGENARSSYNGNPSAVHSYTNSPDAIRVSKAIEFVKDNYPSFLSSEVRDKLGITVNGEKDLRYSEIASTSEELNKKNEELKQTVKDLNKALKRAEKAEAQLKTTVPHLAKGEAEKIAKNYLDQLGENASKNSQKEIANRINELANYILQNGEQGVIDSDAVKSKAIGIAEKIVDSYTVKTDEGTEPYLSGYERAVAIEELSNRIASDVIAEDVKLAKPTFADKAKEALEKARFDLGLEMEKQREEYEQKIANTKDEAEAAAYRAEYEKQQAVSAMQKKIDYEKLFDKIIADENKQQHKEDAKALKSAETQRDKNKAALEKWKQAYKDEKYRGKYNVGQMKEEKDKYIAYLKLFDSINTDDMKSKMSALRKSEIEKRKVLKEQYSEQIRKGREQRKKSAIIKDIEDRVKKISGIELNGTDKHHVPDAIKNFVADALQRINTSSVDKKTGEVVQTKKTESFEALRKKLKEISDVTIVDEDLFNDNSFYGDDETAKSMISFLDGIKDTPLRNLSLYELEIAQNTIKAIDKAIKEMNKAHNAERFKLVSDFGEAIIDENGYKNNGFKGMKFMHGLKRFLTLENLTPEAYFRRLGDSGNAIFRSLRNAQDKYITAVKNASDEVGRIFSAAGFTKRDVKNCEKKSIKVTLGGSEIEMTKAQIMNLYNLWHSGDEAREHILEGGIRPATIEKNGRVTETVKITKGITEEELNAIFNDVNIMSAKDIAICDALRAFLGTTMAVYGNEAALEVFGYEKFTKGENYWPIEVNKQEVKTNDATANADQNKPMSPASMGMAKNRLPGAKNSVMVGSIFQTVNNSVANMCTYGSYLGIMETLKRVVNYNNKTTNVKETLDGVYGEGGYHYFVKLLQDMSGGIKSESMLTSGLIAMQKVASIAANVRVVAQQPTAILRAMSMIDAKYMQKADTTKLNKVKSFEEMKKYCPIAVWKDWGYFDINSGRSLYDILFDTPDTLNELREAVTAPAGFADSIAWGNLWEAVKFETADKYPDIEVGSEEFFKKCAKRATEIIDRTQVVDGMLQRSQMMRSNSELKRMVPSFMGEATKQYNEFLSALYEYNHADDTGNAETKHRKKKAASRQLSRTAASLAFAAIVNSVVQSFVDAARSDDEAESYLEKVLIAMFGIKPGDDIIVTSEKTKDKNRRKTWENIKKIYSGNIEQSFNPLTYLPYSRDVNSILMGYDVERMDMVIISDIVQNAGTLMKSTLHSGSKYTAVYSSMMLLESVAKCWGIPVQNIRRDLFALLKTYSLVSGDEKPAEIINKLMYKK